MRACPVVILTGLSGAGKSTALKVFEDLRFYCVDGLPARLLPTLVDLFTSQTQEYKGLALGMDVRQADFLHELSPALDAVTRSGVKPAILFFEAETVELVRRFSTTRRPHPLQTENVGLEQALELERERMVRLRDAADLVIDTTAITTMEIASALANDSVTEMTATVMSTAVAAAATTRTNARTAR